MGMLCATLKRWLLISPLLFLIAVAPVLFLCTRNAAQATRSAVTGDHHYFYDFPNGSMNVYDMDNHFALVQSVALPTTNVRGAVFDPRSGMLYFSNGGNGGANGTGQLIKYNLATQSVVYRQNYNFGVDSMAITPDGRTIYMPDGSAGSDGTWHIINTATGQVTGAILTASGIAPHDTDMSASGQYVYMEGVDSNMLWVASTASGQIVRKVGPFSHFLRPFVVNQSGTLAYVTENGIIGFGVGNLQTGQVLYTVSAPGFSLPPGFDPQYVTPSHGISLSPDGRTVYVVDMPNSYVHVFNVSGLPGSAPTMTASIQIAPISGTESPCSIDCAKEGWLEQSLDGRYLFVGNSGSIIDTTTNKVIMNLATLSDTRMFLEVDWVNGVPVNSEDRTDFYWKSGPVLPPPTATATPTPGKTATPTPGKTATPTPGKTATATASGLGTQPQSLTPTSSTNPTQQPVAQNQILGSGQSGDKIMPTLLAGAIVVLLAAIPIVMLWRRRKQAKQAATSLPSIMPAAPSFNPPPMGGVAPPAQPPSNWTQDMNQDGWSVQQPSLSLPTVHTGTNGNRSMGLLSATRRYAGETPGVPASNTVPGGGMPAVPSAMPPAAQTQGNGSLQASQAASQQAQGWQFIPPGKMPPDAL